MPPAEQLLLPTRRVQPVEQMPPPTERAPVVEQLPPPAKRVPPALAPTLQPDLGQPEVWAVADMDAEHQAPPDQNGLRGPHHGLAAVDTDAERQAHKDEASDQDDLIELPPAIINGINRWWKYMRSRQRPAGDVLMMAARDLFAQLKVDATVYPQLADASHRAVVDALQEIARLGGIPDDEATRIMGEGRQAANRPSNGAGDAHESWPDPDWSILEDRRGELPSFPINKMPADTRYWLTNAAHGAGVTPAHVAVPLLAIAAGLVGAARRVRASNSWSEPFTLWAAVVGLSGTGKTPGIDVSKRAVSAVERDRRGKVAELRRLHETTVEAATVARKRWQEEMKKAAEGGESPPPMPVEATKPEEFVAPRLWVSDATIERLAVLLRARPSGLLMICDELAGLFLNMGRYNDGHDHEFWLEAWNGKSYVVERMGRQPVEIEYLMIGVVGGFQPDKLVRSFERDDDGMYARILFTWPDEPDYQPLTNNVIEDDPAVHNAFGRLVRLTDAPIGQVSAVSAVSVVPAGPTSEKADGGFRSSCSICSPKTVWLSDAALEKFERFRQLLHKKKSELDGREREWLSKGATHVLRLAGTLEYLAWAWKGGDEPNEISVEALQNAIDLVISYFWAHARAALRQVGLSDSHKNQRRVLRWIRANRKEEVSVQHLRREALGGSLDAEETEQLLSALVRSGWLKELRAPGGPKGGKPRKRWLVNPILFRTAETAQTAETRPVGVQDA